MSERSEFCLAAQEAGANVSALCTLYGISRKTGYKWLNRYAEMGEKGLEERSRRPYSSPRQSTAVLEQAVVAVRLAHPAWGGRKIAHVLARQGMKDVPSASTITTILRRRGLLDPQESARHRPVQRFAREHPNELWQMDFKGSFALANSTICHPLTVLDDHSRFLLRLQASHNETRATVQEALTVLFHTYGMPQQMLADNGPPWGYGPGLSPFPAGDVRIRHTRLTVWLLQLDVPVTHGRPRHPQTQGKAERLHRTLREELLKHTFLPDFDACQHAFDTWRTLYNHERPHEALDMAVPADYYTPSARAFPKQLPPIVYDEGTIVRTIDVNGRLYFANRTWRIGKAFQTKRVAVLPTALDGQFDVCFGQHRIHTIDLNDAVKPVP